jgi:hypothetical protein
LDGQALTLGIQTDSVDLGIKLVISHICTATSAMIMTRCFMVDTLHVFVNLRRIHHEQMTVQIYSVLRCPGVTCLFLSNQSLCFCQGNGEQNRSNMEVLCLES